METGGGGILGRLSEKVLGWIILGGLVALGFAIYQMDSTTRWAIWNGIWRTVVWVAILAGLPWMTRLVIGRLLAFGTNWAGVAWLVALGLVEAIIGLILLRGWPSGGWGWFAGLAALAVASTYNYLVTEYVAEQAGG